jgi:hypothetical protein
MIDWLHSYDDATARARREGKFVLLDIFSAT